MTPWTDLDLWKLRELKRTGKSAREIAKLLDRSRSAVIRAAKYYDLGSWNTKPGAPSNKRSIPDDFAQHAHETYVELSARYSASSGTLKAWLTQVGVNKARVPKPKPEKPKRSTTSRADKHFWPVERHQRDDSELGEAVSYLRQFGPVIRSGTDGRYNERGTMWRRGNTLLTADEILERAASNKRREKRG